MSGIGPAKIGVIVALLIVLGVPFLFRPEKDYRPENAARVIIITPHNEQIRSEFDRAFDQWHREKYNQPAVIEWRQPGGTSEIRRQLQAVYSGAIANGQLTISGALSNPESPMPNDLLFGGGSYEHGQMKLGVSVELDPRQPRIREQLASTLHQAVESRALADGDIDALLALVFHPGLTAETKPADLAISAADLPDSVRSAIADQQISTLDDACRAVFGVPCDETLAVVSQASAADGPLGARVTLRRAGSRLVVNMPIGVPAPFAQARLDEWFGENRVGSEQIYDPDKFWLGTALSGFGIVYNRDVLDRLSVDEPTSWRDMCKGDLVSWVALADPRQSGSVATAYDSILNNYDWELGWQTLREMGANARYFANSSPKVPIDVSQGEAAIGVAIDFYGRYQAQAIMEAQRAMGQNVSASTSRVGYIDPPGEVYIDADPITMLRAGPNPEIAARFIEFVLSDRGQALWQFPADENADLGPRRYELRRMPVRRDFIARYMDRFIDQVNPFDIASTTPSRGWRSAIGPMMGAFAIDTHDALVDAWRALNNARDAVEQGRFPAQTLAEMERLFYAMPEHTMPDGSVLLFNPENYRAIRGDWRNSGEQAASIRYREFFLRNYQEVVRLWKSGSEPSQVARRDDQHTRPNP